MTAVARTSINCKWQTCPLIREGAPHQQTHICLTVIKIWSWAPDECLTLRQISRLIVDCSITLTLSQSSVRRTGSWCEMPAGLQGCEPGSRMTSTVGIYYQAAQWKPWLRTLDFVWQWFVKCYIVAQSRDSIMNTQQVGFMSKIRGMNMV
jgi:hypothetical protein